MHYSVFFSLLHLHFKSIFCSFFCRYFQDQGNSVALEMLEEGIFSVMFCTFFSFYFSQQNLIVWSSIFGAFVTEKLWFSRSKSIEQKKRTKKWWWSFKICNVETNEFPCLKKILHKIWKYDKNTGDFSAKK